MEIPDKTKFHSWKFHKFVLDCSLKIPKGQQRMKFHILISLLYIYLAPFKNLRDVCEV